MRRILCAVALSLCGVGFAAELGNEITVADFFSVVQGEYDLQKADGKTSKYKTCSAEDSTDEFLLTFPYCQSEEDSGCDSGYISFPKPTTTDVKVYKLEKKTGETLYTIHQKDGGTEFTYEWEIPNNPNSAFTFRRFGYVYGSRGPFTLEFKFIPRVP